MIVINTTYQIDCDIESAFKGWLKVEYIPKVMRSGELHSPVLMKILTEEADGVGYCLQFQVADTDTLNDWFNKEGARLSELSAQRFGQKVLAFTTLLELETI